LKQYLVIGLGRFGSSVAKTLYRADENVLAVDSDENLVQEAINNNIVDNAVVLDATEEKGLNELGVTNFDVAFVCIGSKMQASILVTLMLKDLGVPRVIAKAINKQHGKVLEKVGADQVIFPESSMGKKVAQIAMEPNVLEHIKFSEDFLLVEQKAPAKFHNKTLIELGVRNKYKINIVGIKKEDGAFNPTPNADTKIEKGDTLLIITDAKTAAHLESLR